MLPFINSSFSDGRMYFKDDNRSLMKPAGSEVMYKNREILCCMFYQTLSELNLRSPTKIICERKTLSKKV
jgi:hypothetical protein